ncbi:MAG TPA: NAD(P)/FAD-dependent oxidoreductase [Polyangiaceae bacterium]|jgi:monoamine oxidase|nr:NAD(P)/FAD-dependent oxidoreductase [Polyangiaceae bacterium]
MTKSCDVIVVGAGMAGLRAAEELARAGKRVTVLEAGTRIGGRVFTISRADALPIELGAEFVHGKPEPTLQLAKRANIRLIPLEDRHFSKSGGRLVEDDDAFEPLREILGKLGPNDPDETARAFVERQGIDPIAREHFRQLVEGFEAAPLDEVSIQSLRTDSSSLSDDGSQFRVQGGYGTLARYLEQSARAAGAHFEFDAAVARIEHRAGARVVVHFEAERAPLSARSIVVAVPLGVLQANPNDHGLCFDPPLAELERPLARLAMGHACRVTLRFPAAFALNRLPEGASFLHDATLAFETFWLRKSRSELLWTTWAGGPKARLLASEPHVKRDAIAIHALASLLEVDPGQVQHELLELHAHDFSNDPRARGAYSFMRPNGASAAEELSKPLRAALVIAGEATDHRYPGTVAGALASGARAATQILELLAD